MTSHKAGAMAPTLIEIKVKCTVHGIECLIMRPGYSTTQKGVVRCPHCKGVHAYHLDYDPVKVYEGQAPRVKPNAK